MPTPTADKTTQALHRAAEEIARSDHLLISAGAGMGVDSGLPDFRGNEGFWKAYPKFRQTGLSFTDLANPAWFDRKPAQAWGFYGHRFNLYRKTLPHPGFQILRSWAESANSSFVFTSNVDGHFQRAGFPPESIYECHGSILHLQCSRACTDRIWPADFDHIALNEEALLADEPLPACPLCGAVARPNILMFGDGRWLPDRSDEQERRYIQWLGETQVSGEKKQGSGRIRGNLAVIELGAGLAVPTVRWAGEATGGNLIRINPRDHEVPAGGIAIPLGAMSALEKIADILGRSG
ncbi:MAG: NAD-dependent protein deacetylase [Gammaproteobacteria bacterium]|nr:MAG: NAD-dependent protein deacetylase [Pseudomonadota bacterium]PIE38467.1 MAG: NAD-dependent protein deacetylase [Gammaproteobacteria bacterium]